MEARTIVFHLSPCSADSYASQRALTLLWRRCCLMIKRADPIELLVDYTILLIALGLLLAEYLAQFVRLRGAPLPARR